MSFFGGSGLSYVGSLRSLPAKKGCKASKIWGTTGMRACSLQSLSRPHKAQVHAQRVNSLHGPTQKSDTRLTLEMILELTPHTCSSGYQLCCAVHPWNTLGDLWQQDRGLGRALKGASWALRGRGFGVSRERVYRFFWLHGFGIFVLNASSI